MNALLLWMWLAQSADTISTCRALHSGRFVEANSVMPSSCRGIALTKGLVVGGISTLAITRPNTATKVMVSIAAGAGTVAATINISRLKK